MMIDENRSATPSEWKSPNGFSTAIAWSEPPAIEHMQTRMTEAKKSEWRWLTSQALP